MSLKFNPDDSLLNASWAAVLLSERDVAGQVPVNFVTTSAISLTQACFGNNIYERTAAGKCISNLLAVGYRRFIIDLYWSSDLRDWLLCPVTIPRKVQVETVTPDAGGTSTVTAEVAQETATVEVDPSSGYPLYRLSIYRCSDGLSASDVVDVFSDYFQDTNTEYNVYSRLLSFNLHAAASAASVEQPASQVTGSQLPTGSEILGSIVQKSLSSYIYTPSHLFADRLNLNESWYKVPDAYMPIIEYFTIYTDSSGTQSTPDGWPNTKYLQYFAGRRLLIEYGSIDSQLSDYNISENNDVIFDPNYLTAFVPVSTANDGVLDGGCLYVSEESQISSVNASWALTNHIPTPSNLNNEELLRYMSEMVVNLTACGITSTLNTTLFGATADNEPDPYRDLSLSSSWAWAVDEPQVATDIDPADTSTFRCAVMDILDMGHWRSTNCTEVRRSACRVQNNPFVWVLSPSANTYSDAYYHGCPADTSLSVPRTGLENTYLYRYLLNLSEDLIDPTSEDPFKREVWIDINSIDIATCWVAGGPEASCEYGSNEQQLQKKTVLIAAIAGIVICIIAALTLFVKCNANRRNSRRNKRVIQGWEYEGVPS